jgi:hypothetical protein
MDVKQFEPFFLDISQCLAIYMHKFRALWRIFRNPGPEMSQIRHGDFDPKT